MKLKLLLLVPLIPACDSVVSQVPLSVPVSAMHSSRAVVLLPPLVCFHHFLHPVGCLHSHGTCMALSHTAPGHPLQGLLHYLFFSFREGVDQGPAAWKERSPCFGAFQAKYVDK